MGLPTIRDTQWATWNGIINLPQRPTVTFSSPVLRGTGAIVLPQRAAESPILTQTFLDSRASADALIAKCYALSGYLVSAVDDEGVTYANLFVRSIACAKPMKKIGETTTGTQGAVWHVVANWVFIAPLPENS